MPGIITYHDVVNIIDDGCSLRAEFSNGDTINIPKSSTFLTLENNIIEADGIWINNVYGIRINIVYANIVLPASANEADLYNIIQGYLNADTCATGGGGTGDVVGPAGAIDDDIALFDGVTGKLLKDGGKKLSDLVKSGDTAGGELAGTYPNPTLVNAAVIAKILTGLSVTGGAILSTDTILQAFGKAQNQINALVGGVNYQGVWNATTNSPSLASGTGTKGYYYVVSVAGSTSLDGITDWKLGDWAIFNGATWQKVDNTDAVISVNGYTGAVSLVTADIAEATNLYFTAARVLATVLTGFTSGAGTVSASDTVSQAIQKLDGNIALKAPLASPALTGTPTAPTAAVGTNTTQVATTAFVKSEISSQSGSPLYIKDSFTTNNRPFNCLYVPSAGKLYVANLSSGNVQIYNTSTGALLATLTISGALQCFYVTNTAVPEVWVSANASTTVTRITVSSDSSPGTFTAGNQAMACIDYSASKVFLINQGTSTVSVIDPSAFTVSATISNATLGTPANIRSACLNTGGGSTQDDRILIVGSAGLCLVNPSTNAVTITYTNPSTAISQGRQCLYLAGIDRYVITNQGGNLTFITPASATTFSLDKNYIGLKEPSGLGYDSSVGASGTLFIMSNNALGTLANMSWYDISTGFVSKIITTPTGYVTGTGGAFAFISMDTANKKIYCVGDTGTNVNNPVLRLNYSS